MKLIRQTAITESNLVSSSISELDYAPWDSSVNYTSGSMCIKNHRIYESLQATNLNHDPESSIGWWIDTGPTNKWAMFDGVVGTVSTASESISVTLAAGRIDSIALLQVDAAEVNVTMNRGAEVVYFRTVQLIDNSNVIDWFSYFYEPSESKDYAVLTDLPIFGEATITITISRPSGTVSCGMLIVGLKYELGGTMISPNLGINDYSRKSTDDFGNTTLVKRSFSKKMGVKLVLNNSDVDRVHSVLSAARSTPSVWVGSDRFSSMIIYGFYRDFEVDIAYAYVSYCTVNIEGMI